MKNKRILFLTQAAMIAAVYVVLTFIANAFGLANYVIQIRFSEALTILPFFTSAAVPGIFVGCLLSNILTGCLPLDVIFGSLASLIGALGTYAIGHAGLKKSSAPDSSYQSSPGSALRKWLCPLPPIIANTLIVPFILAYVYQFEGSVPYFMFTVGCGEIISCGILGLILLFSLNKYRKNLF